MRRYWYDALPGKLKKTKEKNPAEIAFGYCNQLFELDAETRKATPWRQSLPYGSLTGRGLKS